MCDGQKCKVLHVAPLWSYLLFLHLMCLFSFFHSICEEFKKRDGSQTKWLLDEIAKMCFQIGTHSLLELSQCFGSWKGISKATIHVYVQNNVKQPVQGIVYNAIDFTLD